MNTVLTSEYIVKNRDVGFDSLFKPSALLELFEDLVSVNSKDIGIDIQTVRSYGIKWIITKIIAKINKTPRLGEKIIISTWPKKPGAIKCLRYFTVKNEAGESLVDISSVWCVLGIEDDKIMRASEVKMPADAVFSEEEAEVSGIPRPVSALDGKLMFDYKFSYGDIDINRHVNNIAYLRLAENVFSFCELEKKRIVGFETDFLAQSFDGEKAFAYRRDDGNVVYVSILVAGKEVFRCSFLLEDI